MVESFPAGSLVVGSSEGVEEGSSVAGSFVVGSSEVVEEESSVAGSFEVVVGESFPAGGCLARSFLEGSSLAYILHVGKHPGVLYVEKGSKKAGFRRKRHSNLDS